MTASLRIFCVLQFPDRPDGKLSRDTLMRAMLATHVYPLLDVFALDDFQDVI